MSNENKKRRIEFALWTAMLAPPIAWLIHFQIIYANVLPSCVMHTRVGLITSSILCLVIATGSGVLAWLGLNRNPAPDELIKSRRFMSRLGLMTSAMFSLVVIAQAIAIIVFSPCQ